MAERKKKSIFQGNLTMLFILKKVINYIMHVSRLAQLKRVSKYCTKFQISEQRGPFKGINTCSITNFGDFRFTSVLLYEYESRSTSMRPDINYLILKLQRQRYPSIDGVNAIHTRSKFFHPDLSQFDKYLSGSTYVTFDDTMLT